MKTPRIDWEPLRAEAATTQPVTADVKAKNAADWAISSRADEKSPEGSTTRTSNLKPSAEELRRMYAEMTTRQIAGKLGVSPRTASRWVGAVCELRRPGERVSGDKLRSDWLRLQYVELDRSSEVIAKELGCTPKTVTNALRKSGIEVRASNAGRKFPEAGKKLSQAMKGKYVGDKNPNWKGNAVKKYLRDRNSYAAREWARQVKERDGYRCVKCQATGKLHAHHVVPWRKDASKRFDVGNGISLCIQCHQLEHEHEFAAWLLGKGKSPTSTGQPDG